MTEGSEYKLTVTGRQSGKAVTVDFQAPAANSADKNNGKPGAGNADKNGVIASGKVNNDTKAGPFGAALLGKTGTAVLAAAVAIAMLVAVAMLIKTAKAAAEMLPSAGGFGFCAKLSEVCSRIFAILGIITCDSKLSGVGSSFGKHERRQSGNGDPKLERRTKRTYSEPIAKETKYGTRSWHRSGYYQFLHRNA